MIYPKSILLMSYVSKINNHDLCNVEPLIAMNELSSEHTQRNTEKNYLRVTSKVGNYFHLSQM